MKSVREVVEERVKAFSAFEALVTAHELSHLKIAKWLKLPVTTFSLVPRRTNRNTISFGHITFKPRNFIDKLLVGIGGWFLFIYWIGKDGKPLLKFALHRTFLLGEIKQLFIKVWVEEKMTNTIPTSIPTPIPASIPNACMRGDVHENNAERC